MAFRSASTFFVSDASSASAFFIAAVRSSASSIRSSTLSSAAFISVCANSISFWTAANSTFVLTAIACSRNLDRRPCVKRDGLLVLAPGGLALREPFLGGGDGVARGGEPGFEHFLAVRFLGEPAFGGLRGGVEALEHDDVFEICVHKQKKPRRVSTGACSAPVVLECCGPSLILI